MNEPESVRSRWESAGRVQPARGEVRALPWVTLGELARTFFLLGLTAYGGPAIVAQIRQTTLRKAWLTEGELEDSLAYCQMLPGPVAVQFGAHIGWRLRGGIGAFIALTTYIAPAFLLMMILSAVYFRVGEISIVVAMLKGLRAATVGIVVGAILSMGRTALKSWRSVPIALGSAAGFLLHLNVLLVLAGAALAGVLLLPRASATMSGTAIRPDDQPDTVIGTSLVWPVMILAAFVAMILSANWLGPFYPPLGIAMAKVNLLAFGGGYTALALMYNQAVTAHAWISGSEFIDGLAMSQVTPGPVIVTATFIGYKLGGVSGAVFATVCVILPSGVLMVVFAPQFARVRKFKLMGPLVQGLLAAFIGMLLYVLWQVASVGVNDPFTIALAIGSIVALRLKPNPVWIVLGAVAISLIFAR